MKSKIAIFLPSLDINRNTYNFKEIINLINYLNSRNYTLDIYIGKFNDSFNKYDKNLFKSYFSNLGIYGMPKYFQFYEDDKCNIFDVTKELTDKININSNNFYLGYMPKKL